jgi:hypothetical protein
MKNILSILAILTLIFLSTGISAFAKKPQIVNKSIDVTAKIGEFNLAVSGIVSPFASLSIISGGNVYKSVSANSSGAFSFSDILINRGFSDFCIDAVDWKRLGESYTCFSFPPARNNITIADVFLPPTLGVNHREVPEGSDVIISGYTMPKSEVKVHVNSGEVLATADVSGHYSYKLKRIKKGTYELYAGAHYQGKDSLDPARKLTLTAISLGEYWAKLIQNLIGWLLGHAYLLVIPSLLFLFLIVVFALWHERILIYLHLRQKKLHHAWMVGY